MGMHDLKLILLVLIPVAILVAVAAILPIFLTREGEYVRRFVWDPPVTKVSHGESNLSAEDLERLSKDPQQQRILDNMRSMPNEIPCRPIYIGTRWGPDRNWLGWLALCSVYGFGAFIVYKWIDRG